MDTGKNMKNSSSKTISVEQFVSKMTPLIDMEKVRSASEEAEISASMSSGANRTLDSAAKRGSTMLNLKCVDVQTGLMGKTLLELQSNKGDVLPAHKFGTHDVVVLKPNKADPGSPALGQGVVYRLKDSSITIAFDDIPEEGLNSPLRIEKLTNEVTYRRMKDTLIQLSKGIQRGPAADLVPVLFGERPPTVVKKDVSFTPFNKNLDHSQKDAIKKALSSKDLFLLHGPPGTGKTTTVVEIILQEVKRGSKILACAASNIAVDNIVERLVPHKVKLVRVGHPARLLPQVLDSALDAQVLRGDNSSLANDIRKEMKVGSGGYHPCLWRQRSRVRSSLLARLEALNGKLLKAKDRNTKRDIRKELRILSKEERKRQQLAVTDVIKNADVVLTTLTGSLTKKLDGTSFDLVIIDEAAQALEVACWIALLKGSRCILSGDHLQLPPTIQSVEAEKKGLGRTLFERLADLYGDEVISMLTVQYRMHELIMDWSSKELYNNKVKAHASVAGHALYELEDVQKSSSAEPTLLLIDTAGFKRIGDVICDMEEKKDEEESTLNEGEAEIAIAHAKRLIQSGLRASDIGIITPYSAQGVSLRMLRTKEDKLKELEISTVDGFQGREKEAIIISMVRSNSKKEVGFLSDRRRMNVAVTRARRQCCIICDTETVTSDKFLKRLIEYFEENGEYLSGSEYGNE
ncbi:DNA-binding protein SMUBP-2 [Tanacetum coccineum]